MMHLLAQGAQPLACRPNAFHGATVFACGAPHGSGNLPAGEQLNFQTQSSTQLVGAQAVSPPLLPALPQGQTMPPAPLCSWIVPAAPAPDARLEPPARSSPWTGRALSLQPTEEKGWAPLLQHDF